MSQQVLVIGGGDSFKSYKDYIQDLKNVDIELDRIRPHIGWKANLSKHLGKKYDVLLPKMPNSTNAKYKEWKIWLEKILRKLDKKIILVGHSLGAIFLARYLSENKVDKDILTTILVAAPYHVSNSKNESIRRFAVPKSLRLFSEQSKTIFLLYSRDDHTVPFSQLKGYERHLPGAKTRVFKNRGHFNQEHFPELVKLIKDSN